MKNLLEGKKLLLIPGTRFPKTELTVSQVRIKFLSNLHQHPAIWGAYVIRVGYQGCVTCVRPPPKPRESALETWPAVLAFGLLGSANDGPQTNNKPDTNDSIMNAITINVCPLNKYSPSADENDVSSQLHSFQDSRVYVW